MTDIISPENPADRTVTIKVSGNRFTALLNALDALAHRSGNFGEHGTSNEWWGKVATTLDELRNQLAAERLK